MAGRVDFTKFWVGSMGHEWLACLGRYVKQLNELFLKRGEEVMGDFARSLSVWEDIGMFILGPIAVECVRAENAIQKTLPFGTWWET